MALYIFIALALLAAHLEATPVVNNGVNPLFRVAFPRWPQPHPRKHPSKIAVGSPLKKLPLPRSRPRMVMGKPEEEPPPHTEALAAQDSDEISELKGKIDATLHQIDADAAKFAEIDEAQENASKAVEELKAEKQQTLSSIELWRGKEVSDAEQKEQLEKMEALQRGQSEQYNQAQNGIDQKVKQISQIQGETERMKSTLRAVQIQKNRLTQNLRAVASQRDKNQQALDAWKADYQTSIDQLSNDNEELQRKYSAASKENTDLHKSAGELDSVGDKMLSEQEEMRQFIQKSSTEDRELEALNTKFAANNQLLSKQNDVMAEKIKLLKNALLPESSH